MLCLESQRNRTVIVGEDLGIVRPRCTPVHGSPPVFPGCTYSRSEFNSAERTLNAPPPRCLACLNTHDLPPFAAFWQDADENFKKSLTNYLIEKGHLASEQKEHAPTANRGQKTPLWSS